MIGLLWRVRLVYILSISKGIVTRGIYCFGVTFVKERNKHKCYTCLKWFKITTYCLISWQLGNGSWHNNANPTLQPISSSQIHPESTILCIFLCKSPGAVKMAFLLSLLLIPRWTVIENNQKSKLANSQYFLYFAAYCIAYIPIFRNMSFILDDDRQCIIQKPNIYIYRF